MRTCAESFISLISDCVERVKICGSIRRRKPFPKDIDIVAESKVLTKIDVGWFGEKVVTTQVLLQERVGKIIEKGLARPRVKSDGKTMVGDSVAFLEYQKVPLDLYYCFSAKEWFGLVQMRTGSAGFNRMLATRALSMGLKFHGDGKGITDAQGRRVDDGLSEESIFHALRIPYKKPEERD